MPTVNILKDFLNYSFDLHLECLCFEERWSKAEARCSSSTFVSCRTRFQVSCADISPSSSHLRLERSAAGIDTWSLGIHHIDLSHGLAFDTNESHLKKLEVLRRVVLPRVQSWNAESTSLLGGSINWYGFDCWWLILLRASFLSGLLGCMGWMNALASDHNTELHK